MGRRAATETVVETELAADETNGDVPGEPQAPLTSAQRLAVSMSAETVADPFAPDAKFFTEMRVLNRDVSGLLLSDVYCFVNFCKFSEFYVGICRFALSWKVLISSAI